MITFLKKNYILLIELIILILISLTPLLWFGHNQMILGLDSGYPVDFINRFHQRLSTWLSAYLVGEDMSAGMGNISLYGILALVKSLGVPTFGVQKVTFVLWFFAMALSMYFFVRYFFKEPKYWIIRLSAVFIYVFNFHLYSFWVQGVQTTFSAYILLPVVMLLLFKFLNKELSPFKTALYLNLAYFIFNLGGISGFPLLGSSLIALLSLFAFYLFIKSNERVKILIRSSKLLFYSLILFLLFNAYFLVPFLNSFNKQFSSQLSVVGGVEGTVNWLKYISMFDSFTNLFRLQGDNSWYGNSLGHYSREFLINPLLIFVSFIFPALAYASVFVVKEKKLKIITIFFMFLSLGAIFFAAGAHPPTGIIYIFLMEHFPGFLIFRSPYYKFIITLYFSYAVLIGITIYYLFEKIKFNYLIYALFLFLILGYHYPFFLKDKISYEEPLTTMVNVPNYIMEFIKVNKKIIGEKRVLVVPPFYDNFPLKIYKWGYKSVAPLFPSVSDVSMIYNENNLPYNSGLLIQAVYESLREKRLDNFKRLANELNIQYVLLTNDIISDLQEAPTENPKDYENILRSSAFKLAWAKGEWSLYEIRNMTQLDKVRAIDSLTLYQGADPKVDLIALHNSFILRDNYIYKDLEKKFSYLPFDYKINSYSCESCVLLDDVDQIKIKPTNIVMGSLFYPIKTYQERKLLAMYKDDPEKLLAAHLGLSIKRIAELNKVKPNRIDRKTREIFIGTLMNLNLTWKEINKLIELRNTKGINFGLFQTIKQYTGSNKVALEELYNDIDVSKEDPIKISIANNLGELAKTEGLINPILKRNDWPTTFIYDISQRDNKVDKVNIRASSLPKDSENKNTPPKAFALDDKISSLSASSIAEGDFLIPIDKNAKRLMLYFDRPKNLLEEPKQTKINFPTDYENCFYSKIRDFRWNKLYLLRTKIKKTAKPVTRIYLKRDHDIFTTQNDFPINNDFFYPDEVIVLTEDSAGNYSRRFSGKQDDKAASLYFCTSKDENPNDYFEKVSVEEVFRPVVYSSVKTNNASLNKPNVSFSVSSPTEYTIKIDRAKGPFILSFLEAYSSSWELSYTDTNKLLDKHFLLNGYANGWYITREGSYNLKLVFTTQKLFIISLWVSALSVIVVLAYLIIDKFVRKTIYDNN